MLLAIEAAFRGPARTCLPYDAARPESAAAFRHCHVGRMRNEGHVKSQQSWGKRLVRAGIPSVEGRCASRLAPASVTSDATL